MEPSRLTRAAELQSASSPCSAPGAEASRSAAGAAADWVAAKLMGLQSAVAAGRYDERSAARKGETLAEALEASDVAGFDASRPSLRTTGAGRAPGRTVSVDTPLLTPAQAAQLLAVIGLKLGRQRLLVRRGGRVAVGRGGQGGTSSRTGRGMLT